MNRKIDTTWAKRWDFTLDVKDLWAANQDLDTDMDTYHLAQELVKRIRKAGFYGTYEDQERLEEICKAFEDLPDYVGQEDFNPILNAFYNWGDRGKRVWLETV